MIKEFDKIRLKTEEIARIVEVFNDSNFLAEVYANSGDIDIQHVRLSEIKSVFVETEHLLEEAVRGAA